MREAYRVVITELYLEAGDKWGVAGLYAGTYSVQEYSVRHVH